MKKKKRVILFCTAVVIFSAAIFCYNHYFGQRDSFQPEKAETAPVKNILNVNAMVVKTQTMIDEISTVGSLIPDEETNLSFGSSAEVTGIFFQEGSVVHKGDLLAKVNDKPLKAQLAKFEAQLKLAEDRVYRQSALLEKDAVSKEAYEQAVTDLATLKAEIGIVNANINLTELIAPFDGVIGLRNVSLGAYVTPSVVIAKLTKISPLKIDMFLPERYAASVSAGTPLTFTVEGLTKTFNASVYAVEPKVDESTRTIPVRAIYPNSGGELKPGRFVSVSIKMHEIKNAIAIPTEAVVPEMGVDKVYVYRNGKVHAVPITSGLRTESQIQVVDGLSIGDTIVTSGTLQLRESLPVTLDAIL